MAKVGLKETLSLLAAGYKKKDIEALAAIDDELEDINLSSTEAPETVPAAQEPKKEEEKEEEPDYKAMYEDLLAKNKESEAKITKLQKDNIHKDSSVLSYEEKQKEEESLQALVRGFM